MALRSSTSTPARPTEGKRIGSTPRETPAPPVVSARAKPEVKPATERDAFEREGLPPFASHYEAARTIPRFPAGTATVATFTEAQVQALHRAYWSAPPTASMREMAELAYQDPAFKGRKIDDATDKNIGRLSDKMPASFSWGWRSRSLAATSHVLIDALLRAPAGTSVLSIVQGLQKKDPAFPTPGSFTHAAGHAWIEEPERFPFASKLDRVGPKKTDGYKVEARGKADGVRIDGLGRFAMTPELAAEVRALAFSDAVGFHWTQEEFVAYVDQQLGAKGGAANPAAEAARFTITTYRSVHAAFPDVLPSYPDVRAAARERLAHVIHDLHANEGVTTAQGMIEVLHERLGTPLWKTSMLTYLRNEHPTLVPDFRAAKDASAYADARALLDAVLESRLASPGKTYLDVGRALGHTDQRTRELVSLVNRKWPDEFETKTRTDFSPEDVRSLRQAIADAPLNAEMRDVMRILEQEHPQFLARHPYSSPESLYSAVVAHGDLAGGTWHGELRRRYLELFTAAVTKSPEGTDLSEIVNQLLDEHQGAYSLSQVFKMLAVARGDAEAFPALTKLRDPSGAFPWERARVKLTHALAKRVGEAIEAKPNAKLIDVVRGLKRNPAFAREHPTFNIDHVHHLRARYPKLVPYVDDIGIGPNANRIAVQRRELAKVATKVANVANAADDTRGLTIASLARATGVKPHRVLAAIRQSPALFPWYKERPAGTIDLYLATKLAHAVDAAPLGATLESIVDGLKSDPAFRARYPAFNYHSVARLRERYPDIVPNIHARTQILRSKVLVDAIVGAPKGTAFQDIVAPLELPESMKDEGFVKALWQGDPARFPFTKELVSRSGALSLVGRGEKVAHSAAKQADDGALATRLAKMEIIPEKLTVLDKLVDGVKGKPFADTEFLAVQHLLGPQVAMFDAARKLGMTPSRSTIVGIPYSVSDTVVETLGDKGWDVRVPPLDLEAWYGMVRDAIEERIDSALKHGRKIVVFDDGGLIPMMFERYPHIAEHAHLFRIVEQTTRGITVADGVDLHAPVVNVAQSWAKFVEGPMVGSTVQKKLLTRLKGLGVEGVKGKHIGVTGFGTIGAPLAQFLKDQGARVTVLDVGPEAQKRARELGFDVVDGNDPKARAKFFGKQDIIVGATGKQSMTAADFEHLKDGAILGSSSSKLVEIDVETLKALTKKGRVEVVDADSFPPTVRYHLKDGRTIDLLASGFPMNFDGSVEDVAAERIQLTMGLMLAGALQAAGMSAAGLHRLDPSIQLELLASFHDDVGERLGGEAVEQAMTVASTHLRELEKKHGAREHDLRHR